MSTGRVLIADDHPVVREALRLVIASKWSGFAIDEAGSVADVEALIRSHKAYKLVLLDLLLPDAHGFSGLISVKKMLETTPVVMVSTRDDPQTVASARILGASGFVSKSMPLAEMARIFEAAMDGQEGFSVPGKPAGPAAKTLSDLKRRIDSLSAAQLRILLALADGKLNKQIADDMSISEATVKAHLTAIFRKLSVHNRTQAVLAARPLLESPV
jgi:DNA-binding NarL/FixJ family response regulator